LLQATAQEFLQSVIFVFVKHPFDVGDRVTVYNTNLGSLGRSEDYYVTEISLLYTEFKKMEGHIVQAPNSVLNTVFILNHRRSGQLADVFTMRMRHGTPKKLIDELAQRMTEFVVENRRDFTSQIITELTSIEDTTCMNVNLICFHKSSYQNELLRLIRHNKAALALSEYMVALGIQQPRPQIQIAGRDFPVYKTDIQAPSTDDNHPSQRVDPSLLQATRRRAGSRATMSGSDSIPDFQDVVELRKERSPAFIPHQPRIDEVIGEEAATASGTNLERMTSVGSGRFGLFKRSTTLRERGGRNSRDMV
jgi:small-conductance mechanosensitive channel